MDELSPRAVVRIPVHRGRATILVVDEAEAVRGESCRVLRRAGYAAIPARGGIEAAWVLRGSGRVDLLISDVSMLECDDYHFGLPLAHMQQWLPVLYIAPWSHEETVRRGILHPGAPYLQKPFPPSALVRAVGRLLHARPRPVPI
ncbi:MAG TPA: response regulator [Gemmatimonadales bacterium]|nr:response regulator [Gemmatimonadales bacterium]